MKKRVRLGEWAESHSVSYTTAHRLFRQGLIPGASQLASGTIVIEDQDLLEGQTKTLVGYARVSSSSQKDDLERQVERLIVAGASRVVHEIGSGLNGRRPKLRKLLASGDDILCERPDRLVRFGFEYIEACLSGQNRRIVCIERTEIEDDLVKDMIDVMVSFCARLYGRRSARNRAFAGVQAAKKYGENHA